MLLWFVSVILISGYSFPDIDIIDLEIDAAGTVWLLSSSSQVIRLDSSGSFSSFSPAFYGFPSGFSVSPTGKWVLSYLNPGVVCRYDQNDILVQEISFPNAGDVIITGLNIWVIDADRGYVISSQGEVIGRNCVDRNSRFSQQKAGQVIVSGSMGVFLVEAGSVPVKIAETGSGCFSENGILLLTNGYLLEIGGDTLLTELPYNHVSASPVGDMVILWGNGKPVVLE